MPDSLSVAIGVILATLELVETEFGTVENVHVVEIDDNPTNVLGFSLNGHDFEVLVYSKPTKEPTATKSPMRRVRLKMKEPEAPALTEDDRIELEEAVRRHPASQSKVLAGE